MQKCGPAMLSKVQQQPPRHTLWPKVSHLPIWLPKVSASCSCSKMVEGMMAYKLVVAHTCIMSWVPTLHNSEYKVTADLWSFPDHLKWTVQAVKLVDTWNFACLAVVLYSKKFLWGPNFRDFQNPRPKHENKNHKIRNAKIWTHELLNLLKFSHMRFVH